MADVAHPRDEEELGDILDVVFGAGLGDAEVVTDASAVVMTASTAVKSSPDKSSTDLFVLHEGTVVTITDRLDGWCEVVIADGKKGWVEGRKIEII